MLQHSLAAFFIFILILVFQQWKVECRPATQKLIIDGHEWTVPNEAGWEDGKLVFLELT
jgi:hypothetical protein